MNDMAQVIQVLQAGQAEERKKRLQAEQEAAQGRSKKSQKTQRMSRGENRKLVAAMGKGAASSVDIRKDFDDSADARLAAYVSTNQKTLAQLLRAHAQRLRGLLEEKVHLAGGGWWAEGGESRAMGRGRWKTGDGGQMAKCEP